MTGDEGRRRGSLVLVGDIHGQIGKLEKVWTALSQALGEEEFTHAKVIFLGDYIDRGPDPKGVLEWLSTLDARCPDQEHVFIAGNHDFACACFLDLLPVDCACAADTYNDHTPWRAEPPLWEGPGAEGMHLQGRRWAAGEEDFCVYESASTFRSYGVPFADRAALLAAMPEHHKKFIKDMVWVHKAQLTDEQGNPLELVAVHAGLDVKQSAEEQIQMAASRCPDKAWIEFLQGRSGVVPLHPDIPNTLIASGHHGFMSLSEGRLIVDSCGGVSNRPLCAVVVRGRKPESWQVVSE